MSKRTRRQGNTVFTKRFIDGQEVEVMETYRVVKAWKYETLMTEINAYAKMGYTVATWSPFVVPRVAILRKTAIAKLPEFDYDSIDVPDFVTAK
jgi:hypothetical protein